MPLAGAVIDRPLEADILTASKKKKRAERGCRIGRVEYKGADHAQRTYNAETIGLCPSAAPEGGAYLPQRACKQQIDRIAGQSIRGNCEPRHVLALENLEANADDAWQENIGRDRVGDGERQ